jgi:Sporulation and spore germination
MSKRQAVLLFAALAVAALAAVVLYRRGPLRPRRIPHPIVRPKANAPLPVAAAPSTAAAAPVDRVRVTLFFPDRQTGLLHPEGRDLPRPPDAVAFVRELFENLASGPSEATLTPVLPVGVTLRAAYFLPKGLVVLDVAADEKTRQMGSDEELQLVAAIVDTTLQNVAETEHVQILVNGESAETFAGHVDLTRPLGALRDQVAP